MATANEARLGRLYDALETGKLEIDDVPVPPEVVTATPVPAIVLPGGPDRTIARTFEIRFSLAG